MWENDTMFSYSSEATQGTVCHQEDRFEPRFWSLHDFKCYTEPIYLEYFNLVAEVLMNPVWNWSWNTRMEVILPWTLPPSVERPWYTTMVTSPWRVRFTGNVTLPSLNVYSLRNKIRIINVRNSPVTKRARDWVRTATAKLLWIDWMDRNVVCSRWREKSVHFITRRHSWCEITTLLRNYSVDQ